MSYFPCDIPFMSDEELKENGINIPKDVSNTNVGNIEYIRRQDVVDAINANADDLEQNGGIPYAQGARAMAIVVEQIPPADVEIVAYGRWVYIDDDDMLYDTYHCSECRNQITVDSHRRDDIDFTIDDMKRCNKCGARMEWQDE